MLIKIISGGQTGADRTALEVAKELGFPTGGFAPKDYRTERGPDSSLKSLFGLEECKNTDYAYRTALNVQAADLTVWIGRINSPGARCTLKAAANYGKTVICNPDWQGLLAIIKQDNIKTLNVAGNRGSTNPAVIKQTQDLMRPLLVQLSRI